MGKMFSMLWFILTFAGATLCLVFTFEGVHPPYSQKIMTLINL